MVFPLEGPQTHDPAIAMSVSFVHLIESCGVARLTRSPCPAGREVEAGQRHGVGVDGIGACLGVGATR